MEHRHTCTNCQKEFYGRKNKRFCTIECKADYNNDKASKLRELLNDNKILQRNHKILLQAYSQYRNEPIPLNYLLSKGYDKSAPTRRTRTLVYGYEIYISNGIGIRILKKEQEVFAIIYKVNELEYL
jgi:hypothetical protein